MACPTLPATNAAQACDSTSDAASAKANDGGDRGRCRNAKSTVMTRPARWWLNILGLRWSPTSKSSTARERNVWCFRARDTLDVRPHQRALPC
eukprot:2457488-Pleurochrysis_carterae.AAC.1